MANSFSYIITSNKRLSLPGSAQGEFLYHSHLRISTTFALEAIKIFKFIYLFVKKDIQNSCRMVNRGGRAKTLFDRDGKFVKLVLYQPKSRSPSQKMPKQDGL